MSSSTTSLNGVDLAAIGELAQQLAADPGADASTWSAHTTWTGAFTSESHTRVHGPIPSDEPELLGGRRHRAQPGRVRGWPRWSLPRRRLRGLRRGARHRLRSLDIELSGTIDLRVFLGLAEGHAGYERIEATAHVESDADDAALQQLHEHVVRTSPVGNTIEHPVELDARLVRA